MAFFIVGSLAVVSGGIPPYTYQALCLEAENIFANRLIAYLLLGVKIRKLKLDFMTSGTWRRVRQ